MERAWKASPCTAKEDIFNIAKIAVAHAMQQYKFKNYGVLLQILSVYTRDSSTLLNKRGYWYTNQTEVNGT